ncbi:MAG: DNA-3-methyladenine glycosylase I, partial [Candidatus Eremiobacteraeota bacterium]|nr:DNA-3-methyladenine glycosylase I [Candidatus Eremiobacteraeota bacterium]
MMTRAVFQAGLSWSSIAQRWDRYRSAFSDFSAGRVASYDEGDVDRLLSG